MYQDHFGLHDDPFALGPNLRFLFRSRAHAETMAHLGFGLEQGEDIVLISGAIGTGKTLALHNLQAKISKLFRQVLINVTQLTFPEFLKLVLHELDETWPERPDTADLLVRLKDRAGALRRDGRKILLVVDEAQNLDPEALEGIRLLTNIGQPDQQIFQIVLSGQPGLEAKINRPELAQLRQRIRIHYRLEPLSAEETGEYIAHRLAVAGREEPLFTPNAIKKIHVLSGGIPRLVNHLAGHALLVAFVDKDGKVDARHVAAEDMPETPTATAGAPGPVESPTFPAEPSTVGDDQSAPPLAPPKRRKPVPESEPEPAPEPDPKPEDARGAKPELMAPPREKPRRPALQPARPVPPSQHRSRSWVWVWVVVILLGAAGAWALLRDELPVLGGRGNTALSPATPAGSGTDLASGPAVMTPSMEPPTDAPAGSPETRSDVAAAQPAAAAAAAGHWLHVASFRDQDRAERYRGILAAAGVRVQVHATTLGDGAVWQRVLVGPFASDAEANAAAASLEAQGLITFHRLLAE